ncbi:exosome complex component RRP4 [Nematostella vectensis]|uniref:exosome complex component RRP4 n=1 Tax=Nematostella vectensis TaxID=45351 RepID=UPI00207726CB|nr:exosome complex component RRP4 [Nematostella vectensis]XP_048587072.1 exosome complex component RRP4 [Nematostella vectensis]XP_048587073.1 exosome complex component RRP4 [Nematostella vectensis]
MSVDARLPCKRKSVASISVSEPKHIVTPGDVITEDTGYMRGHGTYVQDEKLIASVAGVVERVNKLICVKPFKTRYNGEIGDVVVGRITEVGQKRWKVETFSKLDSVLMLSSVNLPGGELRRRSTQDELMMRNYFAEGDLISAEVQSIFSDGSLSLHTRSLKYGKLKHGTLVKIPPTMVKRCKTHFHNLPCGATVIIGNNGYIFLSTIITPEALGTDGMAEPDQPDISEIRAADREMLARLRNCVVLLAHESILLFDSSLMYAYDESLKFSVKELLKPEVIEEIGTMVRQRLQE